MAMTIFMLVNGMGVVFLLYVLANFWKEGHRQGTATPQFLTGSSQRYSRSVFVRTHSIPESGCVGRSAERVGVNPRDMHGMGGVSKLLGRNRGGCGAGRDTHEGEAALTDPGINVSTVTNKDV
jgi:hypothetical protein